MESAFTARLEPRRPRSPPPARKEGLIAFSDPQQSVLLPRLKMSRRPSSPPPPWAQGTIGFQGPSFETDTIPPTPITPKRFRDRPEGSTYRKLIEASGNNSTAPAERPPMPPKGQTTVGLTARLEAQRLSSPPWAQGAIGFQGPSFETDTIPPTPITPKRFRDRPEGSNYRKLTEAPGKNSIAPVERPPMPPKEPTTVGLTARLEAQRLSSPPPARKNGLIAFIFKGKKQKETKPIINNEPRPTNLGLARIFSYEELIQSTNGFKQELADGGFSRVYLGKLQDGRKVAVKVLFEGIPKRMEQFLNEVTVLSRLRHKNLVSLYGCTDPETQKLLLVYEFVPNGTISDHLHGKLSPLTWAVRIQIAIETAEALAFLHSREPAIIHRDVKTSNILLDNDFHVKVADLGMSRLVPWDTSIVTTLPQGTLGYRDPESDLHCMLTNKSDVYSFGVVLLELISGQQAVDVHRQRDESADIYLFKMALKMISNNELENLVDPKLAYHSDTEIRRMVDSMAELACWCLQQEGNTRPPMEKVLTTLMAIRAGVQ